MANQIVVSAGAKVRNLSGVLTATSGVVSSLPIDGSLGIPQLDVNGKILVSQLPNSVMEYKGTWNVSTNTPTLVNGVGNQGDVYLVEGAAVGGTAFNFGAGPITFFNGDQAIYSGSIWQRASGATGSVTSISITESGDSLNITGSPITTSGTINIGFNGTNLQYVNGAGNLTTFPTLTGYVPYTGATQDVDLGAFSLNGKSLHIKGTGGNGHLGLKHQSASATASANEVSLFADSLGDLSWLNGNLYLSKFITSGNTANRSYTFPNATCNIPNDSLVVHLAGTETITGAKTFSGGVTFTSSLTTTSNITFSNSGFTLVLQPPTLSVNRTVTLPNGTGTLALTSDISYPVTSVFGRTGAVVATSGDYTTAQVTESGNLYFTDSRARLALSLTTTGTSGAATYNNTTGVFNIPNYAPDLSGYVTLAGTQTITGAKTFSTFTKFDGGVILKNNVSASLAGYVGLSAYSASGNKGINIDFDTYSASFYFSGTLPYQYTFPAATGTIALVGGSGVGTVTSVAALTIGTSGTDLSSTVANSTTTPVITLNVPTASATNRGVLASADWTTFNNKQGTITLTTTGTSGAATFSANTLNIPNYGSALSGYLPLTGGTLTGALNGTSASFSSTLLATGVGSNTVLSGTGLKVTSSNANLYLNFSPSFTGGVEGEISSSDNGLRIVAASTSGSPNSLRFLTSNSSGVSTFAMVIDGKQNLGLGVTPSAWAAGGGNLQLKSGVNISWSGQDGYLAANQYYNGTSSIYISNGYATQYAQETGIHKWLTSTASGTAGAAITFTQAMTLGSNGNLGLGITNSSVTRLLVKGVNTSSSNYAFVTTDSADSNLFWVRNDGVSYHSNKVLIGTATVDIYMLDVNGTGRFKLASDRNLAIKYDTNITLSAQADAGAPESLRMYADTFRIYTATTAAGLTERFTIANTGAATFSSSVTSAGALFTAATETRGNIRTTFASDNSYYSLFSNDGALTLDTYGVGGYINFKILGSTKLTIASTGAATFSSSVLANQILRVKNNSSNISFLEFERYSNTQAFSLIEGNGENTTGWLKFYTSDTVRLTIAGNGAATFSSTLEANSTIKVTSANTTGTNINIVNTSSGGYNWNIFSEGSDAIKGPVGSLIFRDSTIGVSRMLITSGGNVEIASGSIKTGAPSGGTAKPWKLGQDTSTLYSATRTIQVEIDGGTYYLLAVKSTDL